MPILTNTRHERFAQGLAKGLSQLEAYTQAGYKPDRGSATKLAQKASISQRIAEIAAPAVEKSKVTAEYLLERLCMEIEGEVEDATQTGRVSAMKLAAQLAGLLIERRENTHHIEPDVLRRRREKIEEHVLKLSQAG